MNNQLDSIQELIDRLQILGPKIELDQEDRSLIEGALEELLVQKFLVITHADTYDRNIRSFNDFDEALKYYNEMLSLDANPVMARAMDIWTI